MVFFYGAEFAPYAAAERWPLVVALSRFGTFTQLGEVQSSLSTAFSDLATFTFWQVKYSSPYLALQSVERYSALNPTGVRYLGLEVARRPAGRGGGGVLARTGPGRSRWSTWAAAGCSAAPASPPVPSTG